LIASTNNEISSIRLTNFDDSPPTFALPLTSESPMLLSKEYFKRKNIIPARDNDTFNDGKCCYCWGEYNDSHKAVRILPSNHVLGHECLLELIEKSPTGDLCPKCRTPLFGCGFLVGELDDEVLAYLDILFWLLERYPEDLL
jgi:hypothetical protein